MCKSKTLEANYPETCNQLKAWANWASGKLVSGFPSKDIIQATIDGGGIDTRGSGLHLTTNPEAEAMEKVLLRLKQIESMQFLAIKFYFTNDNMTFRTMGKIAGFRNKDRARDFLYKAVIWVDSNKTA